jgi:hypothetical protein
MGFRRLPSALVILVSCLVVALSSGLASPARAVITASARAATSAEPGPGWQSVTFEHVTLAVPATWPVYNLTRDPAQCPRLDRHAVYVGTPGPDPDCPAEALSGKTEAVQVMPVNRAGPDLRAATARTTIDGAEVLTNPDRQLTHTIIDVLPAAGVEVSLSYGSNQALIRAIQASIKLTGQRAASAAVNRAMIAATAPAVVPQAQPQGLYQGAGFDTCAAPSATTMSHWLKSPYRAIGIYIGGINRGCAQANLTASWIDTIQHQGWHYFPFYVGLQATCVDALGDASINPSQAAAEGAGAASDAVQQAQDLGIPAGTPLIYDMEAYGKCGSQVVAFLSGWDSRLHADGYPAGVYESFSNISDLLNASSQMVEPDVIHYADWDGKATTTSSYMPSNRWTDHQRLHQYTGGHNATWGGSTLNIDNDQLNVNLGGGSFPQPTPTPAPTSAPVPGPTYSPGPPYQPGPPTSPVPFPFPHIFRIALAANSDGTAEWFATSPAGTLEHAYQDAAKASGWSHARTVGDSPASLASNPAVAADADGHLTVFALDRAGSVVHAWQQRGQPNGWHWGGAIGSGSPGSVTGDPAAVRGPAGQLSVFVTGKTGVVQVTSQQAAGADTGWTPWTAIGGSCASSPVAAAPAGGGLQVFCVTKSGTLADTASAPSGWQSWQPAGTLTGLTGVPAVAAVGTGQAEVVADTSSGALDAAVQSGPAGSWTTVAGPPASVSVHGAPAIVAWPGGGVAVFTQLASGQIGYSVQQPAGTGTWSGWTALGSSAVGVPAAWLSDTGTPEAAVLDGHFKIAVSRYLDSAWTRWTELSGRF